MTLKYVTSIYGCRLRKVYSAVRRSSRKDIDKIFKEGTLIDKALKDAVREALLYHKRNGNPIADWQDGKVVWIPADQIEVDVDADEESEG